MAIVSCEELLTGRSASGKAREAFAYQREWIIHTDSASTSMLTVINAPGIAFGNPHPDDSTVYAIEASVDPLGENPLVYRMRIKYGVLTGENAPAEDGGPGSGSVTFYQAPPDNWSGGSSLTTVGAMSLPLGPGVGEPKYPVINTAGTMFSDVTVEQARFSLTLGRSYPDIGFLTLIGSYTNRINSATWAGCPKHTWLCKGARWEKHTQTENGTLLFYYRVTWEFEHNPDEWNLYLNSVGYLQRRAGELVPIVDGDGNPVSEPHALDNAGVEAPAGQPPAIVKYYPHAELDFTAAFGSPS